jgi:DNA-binding NarL/FixJ family response regulator
LVLNSKQEKAISNPSSVRILVVDDFALWRQFIIAKLQKESTLRVIGVASDGLDAIQKAKELQPDLILLDIALPRLDGIEAARRIRNLVPQSKILVVTQEDDLDVARAALSAGGDGYLFKSDADDELFAAVEAVMSGKKFLSRTMAGSNFAGAPDLQATGQLDGKELNAGCAMPSLLSGKTVRRHEVQYYSDDAFFLDRFTGLIRATLKSGNAVIFAGTEPHRAGVLQRLRTYDFDIRAATIQGRYVALDAAATLSALMVNDQPDPSKFLSVISNLIIPAAKAARALHPRVAICGELAPLLWAQGMAQAAIQLEELWNGIARTCDIDILCAYPSASFRGDEDSQVLRRICEEHSAVHSW